MTFTSKRSYEQTRSERCIRIPNARPHVSPTKVKLAKLVGSPYECPPYLQTSSKYKSKSQLTSKTDDTGDPFSLVILITLPSPIFSALVSAVTSSAARALPHPCFAFGGSPLILRFPFGYPAVMLWSLNFLRQNEIFRKETRTFYLHDLQFSNSGLDCKNGPNRGSHRSYTYLRQRASFSIVHLGSIDALQGVITNGCNPF